jgi:GTP-binding protein
MQQTMAESRAEVRHPVRHDIRNVAIIAHVDHGKTTLVDGLLKQSHIFRDPDAAGSLILDSNPLERERGITILAKNTAVTYHGVKINIIDTPGHADFGGEVERVLNMADGCLLLVDAVEGPMPQTRTVLTHALTLGLKPIVVINKVDRPNARVPEVLEEVSDLFLNLATDPDQLDFPVLYTIARDGRAGTAPELLADDLRPLFDAIIEYIPPPVGDPDGPFQLLVASLDYDSHRGRIAVGRISRGSVAPGQTIARVSLDGTITPGRITYAATYEGLRRVDAERAEAGDIVALTGLAQVTISDTLADPEHTDALPAIAVEEPTLRLTFGVNTSPFGGREGKFVTSRQIRDRLSRELETNVSLRVEPTEQADVFQVSGRGELHLAVLIETMRREGYEFEVSRPEVILKKVEGQTLEPFERLLIDTSAEYTGPVNELLGPRRAILIDLRQDEDGRVRMEFTVPTRGLIGFRNALLTATRGTATMGSVLLGYEPWAGEITSNRGGALIASDTGVATTFGLQNAQERGITFIEPGTPIYTGMIIGQQPRDNDLGINVAKEKKLTNMRSSTGDIAIRLTPPVDMSLDKSLDFLNEDELLEVTPQNLRLRKRFLDANERARLRKDGR